MSSSNLSIPGFIFIATCLTLAGCSSSRERSQVQLGELDFTVTGKNEAQPAFKKGLLLLHSFEYADAAEEFRNAINVDPDFVMAYWGEAMTKNHPLWQEQDYDKGNAILKELAPGATERIEKTKTEIEKDFITGINILYGEGNKAERDSSYAVYMGSLYAKYPGNDEVAAFYSLALNGWDTTFITDGEYVLRLRVFTSDGGVQEVTVPITLQNDTVPTPTLVPTSTAESLANQLPTPFLLAASPTPTDVPRPTPTPMPTNAAALDQNRIYISLGRGALVILGLFAFAGIILRLRRF